MNQLPLNLFEKGRHIPPLHQNALCFVSSTTRIDTNFFFSVFLQFVELGVLEINLKFVQKVLKQIGTSQDDLTFKYLLLSELPEVNHPSLLLSSWIPFSLPSKMLQTRFWTNMELCDDNGIFILVETFNGFLCTAPHTDPTRFLFLISFNGLFQEDAVNLMTEDPDPQEGANTSNYLLECKLKNHFWDYSVSVSMEKMEAASFLPLQIYLDSLEMNHQHQPDKEKEKYKKDVVYSKKWAEHMYSNVFTEAIETPIHAVESQQQSKDGQGGREPAPSPQKSIDLKETK